MKMKYFKSVLIIAMSIALFFFGWAIRSRQDNPNSLLSSMAGFIMGLALIMTALTIYTLINNKNQQL
jgi:nitrogen fixation-related uncharacterized protein